MRFADRSPRLKFVLGLAALAISATLAAQAPIEPSATSADFPNVRRYREANAALVQSATRTRVVFLGDSITEYWGSRQGKWFPHPGWINRGIGGQTTAQLLLRLNEDVLALRPEALVIEGGGNDMRLGFSPEEIRDRIQSIGELAALHHLTVFVVTMTPVCDCIRPLTGLRTVERIRALNSMLSALSKSHGWTLIDNNAPVADGEGRMRADLTVDGVHLNDAGYSLMQPVFESALRRYR